MAKIMAYIRSVSDDRFHIEVWIGCRVVSETDCGSVWTCIEDGYRHIEIDNGRSIIYADDMSVGYGLTADEDGNIVRMHGE